MNTTDTPRTDAYASHWPMETKCVPVEVCRQLERELAEAKVEAKIWRGHYRDAREDLQQWKQSWFILDKKRQKLEAERLRALCKRRGEKIDELEAKLDEQ